MRLLFIKLKHIGDTLLLTPTLAAVRAAYPSAQIWVVVRRSCEGILAGCPAIDRLLTAAAPEAEIRPVSNWWREVQTLRALRRQHFDFAFELGNGGRGRWLVLGAGARRRAAQARYEFPALWRPFFHHLGDFDWWTAHQVEKDFRLVQECVGLPDDIPPLQFDRAAADFSFVEREQLARYVVLHPATRWARKQWPLNRWIEVAHALQREGWRLVLSSGPDPKEVTFCRDIREQSGADATLTEGALVWPQMAGLLYRSSLFVGLDTAAMHLAAACQTPSVVLFGPSWETNWRPWKCPHRLVAPPTGLQPDNTWDQIMQARGRSMEDITVEQVLSACHEMLQSQFRG